jgi:hypothetical protein
MQCTSAILLYTEYLDVVLEAKQGVDLGGSISALAVLVQSLVLFSGVKICKYQIKCRLRQ